MYKMAKTRINDLEIENVYLKSELQERPTLRDQFAMAALTGYVSNHDEFFVDDVVKSCYIIADVMLAARDEPTKN